jgi:hypothetical protein
MQEKLAVITRNINKNNLVISHNYNEKIIHNYDFRPFINNLLNQGFKIKYKDTICK